MVVERVFIDQEYAGIKTVEACIIDNTTDDFIQFLMNNDALENGMDNLENCNAETEYFNGDYDEVEERFGNTVAGAREGDCFYIIKDGDNVIKTIDAKDAANHQYNELIKKLEARGRVTGIGKITEL